MRLTARLFVMFLAGCASWSLLPEAALASVTYPDVIRTRWSVPNGQLPVQGLGCRLCHDNDTGGLNNLRTYFAQRVRNTYSVRSRSDEALRRALDSIRTNGDDSDRDGISDYEEVAKDTTDPNDPRDRRDPEPVPSEGGAGGENGIGGANAEGGTPGEPPPLPPLPPLPELPPPLGHGCSLPAGRAQSHWPALGAAGLLLAGVAYRRRIRSAR